MLMKKNTALRPYIKNCTASLLHGLGIDKVVARKAGVSGRPFVACYHRVVSDYEEAAKNAIPALLTSTRMFEQHLNWIGKHYRVVGLDELEAARTSESLNKGKPLAAITFDDGYRDFLTQALPILESKGMPSAVFVVTDLVGTNSLQVHDELYLLLSESSKQGIVSNDAWAGYLSDMVTESLGGNASFGKTLLVGHDVFGITRVLLERLSREQIANLLVVMRRSISMDAVDLEPFLSLTWEMLRSLSRKGVTVGSHSKSHPLLSGESPASIVAELQQSRQCLEKQLGMAVNHLAYPDGAFNAEVVSAAKLAGYKNAYTICNHQSSDAPQLTVPRLVQWERSAVTVAGAFAPNILSCQVSGVFGGYRQCKRKHVGPS